MRIIRARYRDGSEFLRHYQPAFEGGGIFYPTREALDPGHPVLIEVRMPHLPQRLMLRGTVVWRRQGRHSTKLRAGLGIEFHQADATRRDFLLAAARGEIPEVPPRKHRRLPVDMPAEWRVPNDRVSHNGLLEDISIGGAFIRTSAPASPGTDVVLELVPPGSVMPLAIAARVAWCRRTEGDEGFGMEFRSRDAGGTRRLKELVRRLEEEDRRAEESAEQEDEADEVPTGGV